MFRHLSRWWQMVRHLSTSAARSCEGRCLPNTWLYSASSPLWHLYALALLKRLSVHSHTRSGRQALLPREPLKKPSGKVKEPVRLWGTHQNHPQTLRIPLFHILEEGPGLRNKHSLKKPNTLYTGDNQRE